MKKFRSTTIITLCSALLIVGSLLFAFGRDTALANFVMNAWQGYKLTEGLVGYWSFDGKNMDIGSSTREAYDISGQGNHGDWRNHATTTTVGKIGQAINFDGTNDDILVADNSTLDFSDTSDFTITGWFNRENFFTDDVLVAKKNGISISDVGYEVYVSIAHTLILRVSDGTDEYKLETGAFFATTSGSVWQHFAFVWDQDSAANSEIYVNGEDVNATDTGTISNVGDLANALTLQIGAESDAGFPFHGKIDETRIYNRILSADEIKRLYLQGASLKTNVSHRDELTSGLVGNWTFDGQDMTPNVRDVSGQGNHGGLQNQSPTTTIIGKIGQGLAFDGVNDYVHMGIPSLFTSTFTVTMWAKMTSATGYMFDYRNGNSLVAFRAVSNDIFVRDAAANSPTGGQVSPGYLADGQWHMYSITADGANVRAYRDGVQQGVSRAWTNSISVGNLIIGGSDNGVTNNHAGTLDEIRTYNRALSADEITQLYLMGASLKTNVSHRDELTSGLVGYWTIDGKDIDISSSTKEVYDTAQTNHGDWSNHATTTTIGKIGQGISFDGTDDFVHFATDTYGGGSQPFTVSSWVKYAASPTNGVAVSGGASNLASGSWYLGSWSTLSTKLAFGVANGSWFNADSGITATLGVWYHLVGTFDGQNVRVYVDGTLKATTANTVASAGQIMQIGRATYTPDFAYMNGSIDEVRMYSRALPEEEIKRLYLMGK